MAEQPVTARKQHRCQLCFEPIEPGTRYIYRRLTPWDHSDNDRFSTFRAHQECYHIWTVVANTYGDYFGFPGDKQDWLDLLETYRELRAKEAKAG